MEGRWAAWPCRDAIRPVAMCRTGGISSRCAAGGGFVSRVAAEGERQTGVAETDASTAPSGPPFLQIVSTRPRRHNLQPTCSLCRANVVFSFTPCTLVGAESASSQRTCCLIKRMKLKKLKQLEGASD